MKKTATEIEEHASEKKSSDTIEIKVPKFSLQQSSYTPVLMILLILSSFLLGSLYTKVQYLEKISKNVQNGNQTLPQGTTAQRNRPATGQKVKVGIGHLPIKGSQKAKVTIVAFEDFRCPFCKRFFEDAEAQIIKDYVDTGKVKLAFRQYQFLGPASVVAGNASECANEQGKFWNFHDYLYKNQPSESDTSLFTTDKMAEIASSLGLNAEQFRSCLASNKYQKNVDQDFSDGQNAGTTGTPTLYVNGTSLVGAQPYSAFKILIDQELAK